VTITHREIIKETANNKIFITTMQESFIELTVNFRGLIKIDSVRNCRLRNYMLIDTLKRENKSTRRWLFLIDFG